MENERFNPEKAIVLGGKIIPSSYPSIKHLPGSKMINNQDKLLREQEVSWMTVKTRTPRDIVIVTEKIDGMNASVLRKGDELYPLGRKGYDVRSSVIEWIQSFGDYVNDHRHMFMHLLSDGERVCGEWMIKTDTLKYKLPDQPFIAFDLINGNYRDSYFNFVQRIESVGMEHTGLVHMGAAIPTCIAMQLLGEGFHGVEDGKPEGVVYRYENKDTGYVCSGKYVANQKLGKDEFFRAGDPYEFNDVKSCYKKYRRAEEYTDVLV